MSQNPSSSQSSVASKQPSNRGEVARDYTLTSELAKLCLPAASRDENKKLAWASSICFLFLIVGLVGLKPRHAIPRQPIPEPVEVVPVVFTPPEEPTAASQPEILNAVPEPAPETAVAAPVIATVVAADSAQVAFAVPVEGPVVLAPARFAPPPPPIEVKPQPAQPQPAPPKPTTFASNTSDGGMYPDPSYPRLALQQRQQGKVLLYVVVDMNGMPASVQVKDSSGHAVLDKHAADWIKTRWQWPPGSTRYYYVPIIFQIK